VLETSRQWADAIEIYTLALKTWSTDEPLKYALRRGSHPSQHRPPIL
jgi:hypothetical protein